MSETELTRMLKGAANSGNPSAMKDACETAAMRLSRADQPRPEPVARVTQMNLGSGALIERLTDDVKLGMNLYAEQPRPAVPEDFVLVHIKFLEFWIADGRLQTFEDRELFREAVRYRLAPAVGRG